MTGFGDEDVHTRAAAEGAAVALDKPFDLDDLVEIVRLVAMRHRADVQA
jgi:FixJ family two-component response regulator